VKNGGDRDWGVTVKDKLTVTMEEPDRDSGEEKQPLTVTQNGLTVTGESHKGFKEKQREGETKASPNPKPLAPYPAGLKAAQKKSITPDEGVNEIICYTKGKSPAASFSGKSKQDLKAAIAELGSWTGKEFVHIIDEKIKNCDKFALKTFGSSLAAEFLGSVQAQRQRNAAIEKAAEAERVGQEWEQTFRAIWDDPSIDIDNWVVASMDGDIGDAFNRLDDLKWQAREYRKKLEAFSGEKL